MKFGKVLQNTSEIFPEKRFIRYKKLKKMLKDQTEGRDNHLQERKEETKNEDNRGGCDKNCAFVQLLSSELRALNAYFIGEEENLVIRLQSLHTSLQSTQLDRRLHYYRYLVVFHGEIISLLHWGILNFAAVSKILKKHDKRMPDRPIRSIFMKSIQEQPFYSTELLERLAKKCEKLIEEIVPEEAEGKLPVVPDVDHSESRPYDLKKMLYAIRTWRDLGDNAHTPSTVLPSSKSRSVIQQSSSKREREAEEIQTDCKIARHSE